MRIAVVCNDTRGGVQPYAALATGLAQSGHDVRAVAPAGLSHLFERVGIVVHPLSVDDAAAREATQIAERGAIAAMRLMMREMPAMIGTTTRETLSACQGAEMMTGGIGGLVTGLPVADKLRIPFVKAHLQPVGAPAGSYPGVMVPGMPAWLGARGRLLSHWLSDQAVSMMFRRPMAIARRDVLGLSGASVACEGQPTLYGFSRHVVPLPEGRDRHVTGYWTLPAGQDWWPPPALEAFLAADGPVASVGFGSMRASDPEALVELVREAGRQARVRVVLISGWTPLAGMREDEVVCPVEEVPHDWLFPKTVANVHHGGAGTTGAALAAGVPSLVVPFAADQPFWGRRVAALGVGPAPIARRRLTSASLAHALRRMLDDTGMRSRAAVLGATIRAEDGIGAAVKLFPGP